MLHRILGKIFGAGKLLEARRDARSEKCWEYVQNGASIVIAKAYSCHKIKKGLKVCVYWNRVRLSTLLQSHARGWLQRLNLTRLKVLCLFGSSSIVLSFSLL